MTLPLRPSHSGFLRPFGCGIFIKYFLLGQSPFDSTEIEPDIGAPQSDIFREYKTALMRATAVDKATKQEEKNARKADRPIDPENIAALTLRYLERIPYKTTGCRYNSFIHYFSMLQKLQWVEQSGFIEESEFQEKYANGQPRIYYRLTEKGRTASDYLWVNPHRTLYGN
jgi:hypothetical protein